MSTKIVTIFGLGYVGLPLACLCAENGYLVYGVDIENSKVTNINNGVCPIRDGSLEKDVARLKGLINATTDGISAVQNSDIVIVCVPTPVNKESKPNLSFVESALITISKGLKPGQLIIIESTVAPGTTESLVKEILETSNYKASIDFDLAHCPERIDPGSKNWELKSIPRVVGALSSDGANRAKEFYQSILDAEIYVMSTVKAAEAVKIVENTFRDINIAFVNEMAMSFDVLDIDLIEVLEGASTKPFGFMPFFPGCGVGGHCIPVDPYYLIHAAEEYGFIHQFLNLSREINNNMPNYTIRQLMRAFDESGMNIEHSTITVLGLAYKGGVDDLRGSPALKIIPEIEKMCSNLKIFDPYVPDKSTEIDMASAIKGSDCILILTDHPEFKNILKIILDCGVKIVVDGKNIMDKNLVKNAGLIYRGIGRGL